MEMKEFDSVFVEKVQKMVDENGELKELQDYNTSVICDNKFMYYFKRVYKDEIHK